MSIATLIIGESGTGKSSSLRNLDPADTLLIQAIRKPLPFRATGWGFLDKDKNPGGNIIVTDDHARIMSLMSKTTRKVIVIDDFQYMLANEFMRRSEEVGFQKFTDLARHAWEVFGHASKLADDVRVYFLSHSDTNDSGHTKCKTIGKLLDEKITVEGMFTVVLRTAIDGSNYQFRTRNSGFDTVKSPIGMFDADAIPNDLRAVDEAICSYYEIHNTTKAA